MRRFVTGWVALTLTLAMSVLSTTTATADWEFNHDIFKDDFNDTLFGNWTSSDTTEKLIDVGDRFLGPTDRTAITLMDFANDLLGEVRLVDVSFDSIDLITGLNQLQPLTITLNGDPYVSSLRSTSPARYGISVSSHLINFDLFLDPHAGCCHDLKIDFSAASGESFGLDNLAVDWSQVPEPASFALLMLASVLAIVRPINGPHESAGTQ